MRRLHRIPAPSFLTNRWQDWGERYAQNKTTNPNFLLDTRTFEIQPNLAATPDEQQRAMITIEIFGFNHEGQKAHRKMTWKLYHDSKDLSPDERDDLAFRFMFE